MTAIPDGLAACIQALRAGVAVADPQGFAVIFENAAFFQWFAASGEPAETLFDRMPSLNADRVRARVNEGRAFTAEVQAGRGARAVTLAVEVRRIEADGRAFVLVECQNVTKQKEAEFMLDTYSQMSERNARELTREKERVEKLLLNIMPRSVYNEMKDLGTTTPQRFDAASVLMLDFVGFTEMAVSKDPGTLIGELNDIFTSFDRIVDLYGCERIKTIGDGYLAVSGLPEVNPDHAANIAKVAVRMRRYLEKRNAAHPTQWLCRIGINTGPVIGSLVGIQKYVYDVFGPAVNLAARLEQLCEPMQIALCDETVRLIGDSFIVADIGEFDVKGFGRQRIFALEDERRG